jgi:hypothetical protein
MHPSSTLQLMPIPAALADAGMAVICAASRHPKDDRASIMEKLLIEVGTSPCARGARLRARANHGPCLVAAYPNLEVASGSAGPRQPHCNIK